MRIKQLIGIGLGLILTFSFYGFIGRQYLGQYYIEKSELKYLEPILKPISNLPASKFNRYHAKAYIAIKNKYLNYTLEDSQFELCDTMGDFTFVVDPNFNYFDSDGFGEEIINSSLSLKYQEGNDTILPVTLGFKVKEIKPFVQTGSISVLFQGITNNLRFAVPSLRKVQGINFKIIGGRFSKMEGQNLGIIPDSGKFLKVEVYKDDNLIGNERFRVRKLNNYEYTVLVNEKELNAFDEALGLKISDLKTLNLKPSYSFRDIMISDNELIIHWRVILYRKGKKVVSQKQKNGGLMFLKNIKSKALSGDSLVIKLEKVIIINSLGEELKLDTGENNSYLLR